MLLKNKKLIYCLYDWAGSPFSTVVITFIFAEYFIKSVSGDIISGTTLWGWMISISTLLVAFLGPFLGILADHKNYNQILLIITTIIVSLCSALLWLITPDIDKTLLALVLIGLANFSFELNMIFYNSRLNSFARSENIGSLSGKAWASGYAGGIFCLVFILFFLILPKNPILNISSENFENIRICGPIVGFWFLVFGFPFLFLKNKITNNNSFSIHKSIKKLRLVFSELFQDSDLGRFLISRMFYTDGLNTLFAFGGIYAAGTFNMDFKEIIVFGIAINFTAAFGAFILSFIEDYYGPKKIILISLLFLIILSFLLIIVQSNIWFWVLGLSLGFFIGPIQSSSRSAMIKMSKPEEINKMFGLYALSGKSTAFLGPLLVGSITGIFNSQRIGMATILIFLLIGFVLLLFTKFKNIND